MQWVHVCGCCKKEYMDNEIGSITFCPECSKKMENATNGNINDIKVGDVVVYWVDVGHSYVEYAMNVTCVDKKDFEEDDDGNICLVAFGEGYNEDDKEVIEDCGTNRIDEKPPAYL